MVVTLGLRVGVVLLVLAAGDWLYQRWQHRRDLMMTRRELEDELKQTQGPGAEVRRTGGGTGGTVTEAVSGAAGKGENDG